jgi:hypothetical protein
MAAVTVKTSNFKLQTPEKLQHPGFGATGPMAPLGIWSLKFLWSLKFEVWSF